MFNFNKNLLFYLPISLMLFFIYDNRKKYFLYYNFIKKFSFIKNFSLFFNHSLKNTIISKDQMFIDKYKNNFLNKIKPIIDNNFENIDEFLYLNNNMLNIYYDKNFFNNLIHTNDEYILTWKRRMIIINTPYGNVGMFYNLYNRGFSYYSDIKDIPYIILNCISMHYVLTYLCLDFYVDNTVIDNWISKIWLIFDKDNDDNKESTPFIKRLEDNKLSIKNKKIIPKLKNYRSNFKNDKGEINIKNKNHFIYCGKITDLPLYNKTKITLKQPKLSFKEYKKNFIINNKNNDYSSLF